jgi:arginyl-tRNA--protein-N-Asp/Glu arginylyltransferase
MKIFFSEHNKDYRTYTFDYAVYAEMEDLSDLPGIYDRGFLPYSNDIEDRREIFYLARSLRVELASFEDSSENRRVNRKLEKEELLPEITPKSVFNLKDPYFRNLCLSYAKARFSGNAMTEERFDYILQRKIFTHIINFAPKGQKPIAYIFALIQGNSMHYWYAFFDLSLSAGLPLGKWLMWRTIHLAKKEGLDYIYLGTCYGDKALYKVRDFKSLSFFDGSGWKQDMKKLKSWCKSDDKSLPTDRFKIKNR